MIPRVAAVVLRGVAPHKRRTRNRLVTNSISLLPPPGRQRLGPARQVPDTGAPDPDGERRLAARTLNARTSALELRRVGKTASKALPLACISGFDHAVGRRWWARRARLGKS
jgi:hypothetical protein